MRGGFTRGLVIGGLIGASIGMIKNSDMMKPRSRRRMMRAGRNMIRRTGNALGDVIDLLR
ncbi:MAG TPA: YtxH domain-containing protein [Pseudobacteroides sp.]|uniref:YtxH domain-containing protein n=1 Tax=Pseudobacteroides sp. TaxID=1968840 RepID=UPI002F929288